MARRRNAGRLWEDASTGRWLGREPGRPAIYCFWYDGKTGRVRRKTTGQRDLEGALAWYEKYYGLNANTDDLTEIIAEYVLHLKSMGRRHDPQRAAAKHLLAFCEHEEERGAIGRTVTVWDFTRAFQARFRDWLVERHLSNDSIQTYLKYIRAALNHAHQERRFAAPPPKVYLLPASAIRGNREGYISQDMMVEGLLYARKNSPHLFRAMLAGIGTMARTETVLDIHVGEQYIAEHGLLRLNPPGRSVTIKRRPLVGVPEFLRAWFSIDQGHWVSFRGKRIQRINKTWNTMRDDLGWSKDLKFKAIRGTLAKEIRYAHPDLHSDLQAHLGHVENATTEGYAPQVSRADAPTVLAIQSYFEGLQDRAGDNLLPHFSHIKEQIVPMDLARALKLRS